ncbi:MAG TPA: acyl-CoA dehydrogenase family protein [Holophaga sp.]|nr:acyl-CoA dehydrogenase family protein [Holophaga sp.]
MPDFSLSSEQTAFQAHARRFAQEVVRPASRHHDETGAWPEAIIQAAWREGFLQSAVPREWGGPGRGAFDEVLLAEELAWGCAGMYTTLSANSLACAPIRVAGSETQQKQWLRRLLDAPRLAAFALTEPGAGSDAGALACRAERRGDVYLLNGTKCFITGGDHADFFTVFAKTDPAKGARGLSAFIVSADSPGIEIGPAMDKLGHRASSQVEIHFRDVEIPAEQRIGAEGGGFAIAMRTLDLTRASVAAGAVGLARAAYELALDYAATRVQFGQPIISNQGVSFMLADMATRIEASRLLAWQAAWTADQGARNAKLSAMAKTFATDTAMEAASNAVQILGGLGYSRDSLAEKFFRDAKLMQIYEGTNQIQRLVISKEIQQERRTR